MSAQPDRTPNTATARDRGWRVIWWGWRRSWPPVKYVHRSRFGGFSELLIGPLGIVWNYDQQLAVKEAMHGRQD